MTRSAYGLATPRDVEWRVRAACTPDVAEWFWIEGKGPRKLSFHNREALRLCGSCPVLAQCAAYEAAHPQPYPRIAGGQVIAP